MGEIIRIKCNKADYDRTFNIGQGRMYVKPSGVSDSFDEDTIMKLTDLRAYGYKFDARKVLVFNRDTSDYGSKTVCTLRKDETVKRIIEGMSADKLEVFSDDLQDLESRDLTCPVCGGKLEIVREGFWD